MIKISKLFLIAISVVISNIVISNAALAFPNNPFYAALDIGIFQADFNNRYLDQTTDIPQNIVQPVNQHGYTAGIAVGYNKLFHCCYFLGAELSANIDNHDASFQSGASTAAFSDQVNIQGHVDLTFVSGIKLTDTISAFLKLGISGARLQDSLSSPSGLIPTMTSSDSNKNAFGFAGGLRLAKSICENVSIFTEANYHDYGSVSFPSFENFTATYTHSTHVYSYDVVLGALYNF